MINSGLCFSKKNHANNCVKNRIQKNKRKSKKFFDKLNGIKSENFLSKISLRK